MHRASPPASCIDRGRCLIRYFVGCAGAAGKGGSLELPAGAVCLPLLPVEEEPWQDRVPLRPCLRPVHRSRGRPGASAQSLTLFPSAFSLHYCTYSISSLAGTSDISCSANAFRCRVADAHANSAYLMLALLSHLMLLGRRACTAVDSRCCADAHVACFGCRSAHQTSF